MKRYIDELNTCVMIVCDESEGYKETMPVVIGNSSVSSINWREVKTEEDEYIFTDIITTYLVEVPKDIKDELNKTERNIKIKTLITILIFAAGVWLSIIGGIVLDVKLIIVGVVIMFLTYIYKIYLHTK